MKYSLIVSLLLLAACTNTSSESDVTAELSDKAVVIPPTADSVIVASRVDAVDSTTTKADKNLESTAVLSVEDKQLIESFAQSGAGRNCASISVIKLAIGKYGLAHVFTNVDSSATGYKILLRDGKSIDLSKAELQEVGKFDNFRSVKNPAICKAARFMYAVMAKNKFLLDNAEKPGTWSTAASAANVGGKYHLLIASTTSNFTLLGLEKNYVGNLPIKDAYTKASVVVASNYHSAFGGMSYYDQYGSVESDDNFARKHRKSPLSNNKIQWAYQLVR